MRKAFPERIGAAFLAVLAVLLVAFAIVMPPWLSRAHDPDVDVLTFDAAPSVALLSDIRGATRNLAEDLDRYSDPPGASGPQVTSAQIEELRGRLDSWLRSYLALAPLRDEPPLEQRLVAEKALLDRRADEVLALMRQGRRDEAEIAAEGDVSHAADDVVDTCAELLRVDQSNESSLADEIKRARREGILGVRIASGLALLLAAGALLLAQRSSKARREAERRRAEELEAFAARVSHDLRGPLSTIAFSAALAEQSGDPERRTDALRRIQRTTAQAASLIEDLLRFAVAGARPVPGASAPVRSVLQEIADSLRPKAEAAQIALLVEEAPEACVACPRGVLFSLVANLVENAIKYMRAATTRRVAIRASEDGHTIRIAVVDSGPGIPPAVASSLFEPWVRGDAGGIAGLGLGLATVKRLAEAHGGHVGVESIPGEGATFWFDLPASPAPPR